MSVNQLPSIPMLAIRHLRKRIERLKTYAHIDTAVTLRRWCTIYGGHTMDCASRYGTGSRKCDCGWGEVDKKLTTFSDEFYEEFRKKAS